MNSFHAVSITKETLLLQDLKTILVESGEIKRPMKCDILNFCSSNLDFKIARIKTKSKTLKLKYQFCGFPTYFPYSS